MCKRLKVKVNADAAVLAMESALLQKIADEAFEKMTVEDLGEFVRENAPDSTSIPAKKQQLILAAQAAVRATGFAPYKLAVIVANGVANQLLGPGLTVVLNAGLTKGISLIAGPVGLALNAIWAITDLASPAYRVIIPACCHIAYLRIKYGFGDAWS